MYVKLNLNMGGSLCNGLINVMGRAVRIHTYVELLSERGGTYEGVW